VVLLATRQYEPRQGKRNGAGAKQRNPSVRRTGWRKAGTLLLHAGTECEKNSGQPDHTGRKSAIDRNNRAVEVMHASDDKPAP
jgi:hypothetical protein